MHKSKRALLILAIIGVVVGMVFIHIDPTAAAQPMGITITPTNTLEPPTNTPEPPTNTPEPPTPTGTQITIVPPPSTFTPTATGTLSPTDTPTPTEPVVPPPPSSKTPPSTTTTQVPPILPETGSGPADPSQGGGYWLFALVSLGLLGILFLRGFKRSRS